MKLATSSYTWGRLGNEKETAKMLDDVLNAGLNHLALQPADLLPPSLLSNPGIFKDQAKARGIEIVALGGLNTDLNSRLVRAYGSKLMWAVTGGKTIADWVRASSDLAEDLEGLGVTLTIQPHLNSPIETRQQIEEFFSRIDRSAHPEIKLCLDPGHLVGAHVNPVEIIDEFRERIGLVHITDYVHPPPGRPIVFEETFVDLEDGVVDYPPILRRLKEVGYDGWYMLEAHYPKDRSPMETVRLNRERFERLFDLAG